jgi:hypothetical protein
MAPILELIKKNAVPVNVMRSASKGSLPLPADEMLEVLVFLTQNPLFGQDARMTLAQWDALSAKEVLGKETAVPEVLLYYWQAENRRPSLMPTLIENPAIPENLLMELASTGSREIVTMLMASARARGNPGVMEALLGNDYLTPVEAQELRGNGDSAASGPTQEEDALHEFEVSPEAEAALQVFQQEHAAEIAAIADKPFEMAKEEEPVPAVASTEPEAAGAENVETPTTEVEPKDWTKEETPKTDTPAALMSELEPGEQKRVTVLQKIGRLSVGERIKLGFIGGREERSILIRDTARLVQNAVLSSPKVTDAEVEGYAGSKNLQESVFREIARQRRFIKLYAVVRNLTSNPKCPLDISLTLVKSLMVYDLKSLRHNKNVPDTIRKVAAKLYLEKASRGGAKKE